MTKYIQVLTTIDSKAAAQKIADAVIQERVGACAQIYGPLTSTYRWKGQIERTEEWLCIIKSRADLYERLESVIRANHGYEVPEVVAVPVNSGFSAYLKWMDDELK